MVLEGNKRIAELFRLTALMIEILEDNSFRAKAFERAAETIEALERDICELASHGELESLPGIGKSISQHISRWCHTGVFLEYEKLKDIFPAGLLDILRLPGLGPKKVRSLYTQLGITSIGELEYACLENRLVSIKGFGPKSQQRILSEIENFRRVQKFRYASEAYNTAKEIIEVLKNFNGVENVELVGALRRFQEYTDDVDLLIKAGGTGWIDTLISKKLLDDINISSDILGTVRLEGTFNNMSIDIRHSQGGAGALFVYTGSRSHVEALVDEKIKGTKGLVGSIIPFLKNLLSMNFKDETELYEYFGISFVPPELREGFGEIEKAKNRSIPALIGPNDIRGIFHVHTTLSDGSLELEKVVRLCIELGYEYVGISDHSVSAYYAGGLTEDKLERQRREVEVLRERYPQIDIYWGIESDIRPDGSLDYPDRILETFDFIIGSVHSHLRMDKKAMTERLLRALRHPYLTMLGHPTGRLILARSGYEIDMDAVLETAKSYRKIIELNSHPYRLDIDWKGCKRAKELGIYISINPDAHNIDDFSLRYGILTARKGWLTAADVWNAHSRESMRKLMMKKPWMG
ncbi:MAG: DNA polymerase/3'-5' exonuclease PolX [Syntrophobacterales bacterium]|nr:DNA polymerase/3'-5' exonuclease PolX [Syntrophobacterales bacterium]